MAITKLPPENQKDIVTVFAGGEPELACGKEPEFGESRFNIEACAV